MTPDRRLLGAALGFALVVSACSSSAASSAAASAASSAAATQAAAASTGTGTGGDASTAPDASMPDFSLTPGNASDLEAMLPDKVGSTTITKTSFDYSAIPWASLGSGGGTDDISKVLQANGKSLADVRFAMGVGTGTGTTGMPTMVYALQVKGLDASKFVSGFDTSYDTSSAITVGGKSVHGSVSDGYGTVTYLHNDVAFIAIGSEADLNALVGALP
jgi:hypothetical protein